MAPIVLKFKHGKEIRRLSVEQPLTYAIIKTIMSQLFPSVVNYTLKYEDPDGDKVTVSSQQEIDEAVSVGLGAGNVLRFFVITEKEREKEKAAEKAGSSSEQAPTVHFGVSCDGCNVSPINGVRFKCTVCPDFDLCEACQSLKTHDQSHPLIQFTMCHRADFESRRFHRGVYGGAHCARAMRGCVNDSPLCEKVKKCRYLARFVQDVTIADNSVLKPNERFMKVWKMRNSGDIAWPQGTVLTFVGGDRLGATESVTLPRAVASKEEIDLSVEMIAPENSGRYTGYWRLQGPEGKFGQRVWVDFFVADNKPSETPVQLVEIPSFVPLALETTPAPACNPSSYDSRCCAPFVPNVAEPVAVPVPAPQPPVIVMSNEEIKSISILHEMGFSGDLLSALRTHRGDLVSTIRELVGR